MHKVAGVDRFVWQEENVKQSVEKMNGSIIGEDNLTSSAQCSSGQINGIKVDQFTFQ